MKKLFTIILTVIFAGCLNLNVTIENSQSQTENKSTSTQNISYDKNGRENANIKNEILHKEIKKVQLNREFKNKVKNLEDRYFDLILDFKNLKK